MDRHNTRSAPVEITLDPAAAIVTLRYHGAITAEGLARAHEAMLDAVGDSEVVGIVIDVRDSRPAYSPGELLEQMEAGLTDLALERMALVYGADRERLVMLLETAAFSQGVRVRAFKDPDEARRFASGL